MTKDGRSYGADGIETLRSVGNVWKWSTCRHCGEQVGKYNEAPWAHTGRGQRECLAPTTAEPVLARSDAANG